MKQTLFLLASLFLSFTLSTTHAQTTSSGDMDLMRGFARAVEISDGSIFIGEPANAHQSGIVYVFGQSEGTWSQQHQISASDGFVGDGFGSSLTAEGSRLLVGAPEQADERGAAYVFERAGDGSWTETARLALSDSSVSELGASVALNGDLAFVGAPGELDGQGAVYLFRRTGSGSWTQQARLTNPDTARGTSFGSALAVDGNRLLIGAPETQGGAVYVFESDDKGSWSMKATIASGQISQRAGFGSVMELRGDQALIGAPNHSAGAGAVIVFQLDKKTNRWNPDTWLGAYDGQPRYEFGASLAFVGSDVWIGAPGAERGKGALYNYSYDPGTRQWTGASKLSGPDREQGAEFAGTVAVEENIAVAGLVGADYGMGTAAIMEREPETGTWAVQKTVLGKSTSGLKAITGGKVECENGKASQFGCSNVDLLSFLPIGDIGGDRGVRVNDIWGWTDPQTNKEYALVGRMDGTSFVDVSNPSNPVYVANLQKPDSARTSIWRDIKVYNNHAYIVADNAGTHGMQVVDLTKLRDFDGEPLELTEDAHYDQIHSAHNVVINTDTGFAFVVGSSGGGQTCGGGLHMVNIQDPTNPTFAGCFADPSTGRSGTGYSHDAQCVTYHGPDEQYKGREICIGANETAISIADVTDKENPRAISTASYPDYAYVHQGWLTEDHRYFFQNDELDELNGTVDQTRTLIWDLTDLDDPQFVREFMFDNPASDHNLYIEDNTMYQSNYVSGLQVLDVSDPENPVKTGHFDTEPFGEDAAGFAGTWSNYPFFKSDIVIMSSMSEGLFILQKQQQQEQEL